MFIKAFVALVFSCAVVLGGDGGIRRLTTVRTNESGSVSTRDVFTRDGQTNLARNTSTKSGTVQICVHRFYYHGLLVGDFVAMPERSGFTAKAGCPYSVGVEFGPTKDVTSAVIATKDGTILEAFMATNGLFYPADDSVVRNANDIGADVGKLLSPAHATNTPSGEFLREVEDLVKKHKEK
jgi:hypothetical protein